MANRSPEPSALFAKPAKPKPITAPQILELLRVKHEGDVFVPECKTGPSQGHDHSRFDAWVMRKSWANAETIGYEIKVTRSDFLRDTKWFNYLPFCNSLYFVAPRAVILPSEMPEGVGLITVAESGGRLLTARKAAYRAIAEPAALLRYVLMCRCAITAETNGTGFSRDDRAQRWTDWLAAKKSARSVGHNAGRALRERIDIEIYQEISRAREAERKCEDMASRLGLYADIEAWLAETGLTWRLRGAKSASEFREIFEAKTGQSAAALARELGEASDRLARLAARFMEEPAPSEPEPDS